MDRFKFRAWNKRLNTMYAVYKIDFDEGLVYCETSMGTTHTFGMIDIDLLQFTGLKDKNGKLIFEGDYLKDSYSIGEVVFGEYIVNDVYDCGETTVKGWYTNKTVDRNDNSSYNQKEPLTSESYGDEIIGNKYMNPELLKD